MKPSQAELLLRMAENTYADNNELMAETRRMLAAGAQRILADEEYLMKAWEINQKDKMRFAQYMPIQNVAQGQAALGRTLADQRTALGVVKNDEERPASQQARTDR